MELAHEYVGKDQGPPSNDLENSKQIDYMFQAMEDYEDRGAVPPSFSAYPTLQDGAALPNTYRYARLMSDTTIRLISLEPADNNAYILRCRLESVELRQAHETYDALSYVWGQAQFSSCLYIECESPAPDTVLRITPNLASALRRLRSNSQRRRVWADAICIDQENILEKTLQVNMMAQIYRSARCVCVHLGYGVPEIERCMGFIRAVAYVRAARGESDSYDVLKNDVIIRASLEHTFDTNDPRPILAFLNLPWFKRRWVVQEAASRAAVVFLYGKATILQAHLSMVMGILLNSTFFTDAGSLASLRSLALIQRLQELITQRRAFGASGILHLLVRCHALECSDDRDRIYALLQCAADVEGSLTSCSDQLMHIRSDYNCTPTELYTELAKKCIQCHPTLDILNCAGAFKSGPHALRLPSWVPHWDGALQFKPLLGVSRFGAGVFSTGLIDRPHIEEDSILHVSGYSADRIKSFSRCLPPDPSDMDSVAEYIRQQAEFLYLKCPEMFANDQNTRSSYRAFALTLIADCAFLPLSDLVDDWSEGNRENVSSEEINVLRDGLVTILLLVSNIARPDPDSENLEGPHERGHKAHLYLSMVCRTMSGRAFFITQNGHIGIAPDDIEPGDHVAVLHKCRTPLILRQDELLDRFWIIGDAYVDGLMQGEAADLPNMSWRDLAIS